MKTVWLNMMLALARALTSKKLVDLVLEMVREAEELMGAYSGGDKRAWVQKRVMEAAYVVVPRLLNLLIELAVVYVKRRYS